MTGLIIAVSIAAAGLMLASPLAIMKYRYRGI